MRLLTEFWEDLQLWPSISSFPGLVGLQLRYIDLTGYISLASLVALPMAQVLSHFSVSTL